MNYAVIYKSTQEPIKVSSTSAVMYSNKEELLKAVRSSYLFKSDREKFCNTYTIAEISIKPIDYEFTYKDNKPTEKLTKSNFVKLAKEWINGNNKEPFIFSNIKFIKNEFTTNVYVKNIKYMITEGNSFVEVFTNENYILLYDNWSSWSFTYDNLKYMYDKFVKGIAGTNKDVVYYMDYEGKLRSCPREKWY